jgi:hypothetical protein
VTVNTAMLLNPPSVAKMVTVVFAVTIVVVVVNVAVVAPAGMATVSGTGATVGFELASVAVAPFPPGEELSEIVPVTIVPPLTLAGARVRRASPTTGVSVPQPHSIAAIASKHIGRKTQNKPLKMGTSLPAGPDAPA